MRKPVLAALATAALVTGGLAGAPAANADSQVVLPITGTTSLANPLAGGAVLDMPAGAQLAGSLDIFRDPLLVGDMVIPPITAKVRALGIPVLGDTTSTVVLEPVGKTEARSIEGGYIEARTSFRIALPEVRSDLPLADKLNLGGPDCKTDVISTTLTSTEPLSLTEAFPMKATFTIPEISGCPKFLTIPLSNWALNALMGGDGNTLDLMVGPITTLPSPAPAPSPAPKPTAVAKVASSLKASAKKVTYGKAGKVKVAVRSSRTATGAVRIYKGKKLLATKRLAHGKASVTLRKKSLKAGKHKLRVVYAGSSTVRSSKGTVVVRVVKR
ncbi:Ig-like domain-containing protein [Mumia quercus]|uniref:Ig-like domain-containing protein n=1 Tax=Mumia quercus TaxID=2976125 RepID=UPI0021D09978|nr:Ig-like domain-containing protein [Mumia quercus]